MNGMPLFQRDSYLDRAETSVLRCEPAGGGRSLVVLAETVFYPEGGGQPADRGWISGARVVDVRTANGEIVHEVEGEVPAGRVELRLDWERRYDHMQQHTAQHVLTRLASDRLDWNTTGFGIGPEVSHIDLAIKKPPDERLRELESLAAAEIRASRPVRSLWVSREEMESLPVRSRRLPRDLDGPVRLVEIEGLDLNTCGGTHVANTAELESICLVGTEPMHGGTRVFWVAGGRVRRRLAARENLLASLRRITGAADGELPEVVELKLSQLKEAHGRVRRLRERVAQQIAVDLQRATGPVVAGRVDDGDMLQSVASALAGSEGGCVYLVTAPDGAFALALGRGVPVPAERLGPVAADALGGKGGGRDRLYRGKAPAADRLDQAVRLLARILHEAS